jgi:enamine deaminase RidA (YjgF/YER057c/UK114 family)
MPDTSRHGIGQPLRYLRGGAIIMTMTPVTTAADDGGVEFAIVNQSGLFDPTPCGYSQAVIAPAGGRAAYVSGQGGADSTGALSPDVAAQVEQAFANLRAALEGIGAAPGQVAKLTIYVVDHDPSKLGAVTSAVVETFGATLPAQTLVPVPRLAIGGMLFEVEALAVLD